MKPPKKITIALLLAIATVTTAQTKKTVTKTVTKPTTQTNYPSVQIGEREWMIKNLNVSTFRNGDPIPRAQTDQEWVKAGKEGKPAWCYYHIGYSKTKWYGDPESGKYGKLYNYYAVNDPRGLAPKGWHISTGDDWHNLLMLYINLKVSSYDWEADAQVRLKSTSGWIDQYNPEKDINGTNSSGFNAFAGGFRRSDGYFDSIGDNTRWWIPANNEAYVLKMGEMGGISSEYYNINFVNKREWQDHFEPDHGYGYSVRCVKDIVATPVVQEKKGLTGQNYYENGNIKFKSKDYKGAIEDYSNAIILSPECSFCYQLRGFAKGELKDYNGSISDYKKAIELSDGNLDFISPCQLNIGITYNMIGKKEEGCTFLMDSQNNGNKEAQKYIDQYCGESEPKKESEPTSQTNIVELRSAKQVLPLLMNDLSQESSYKDGITILGYHTTGNNNEGGTIYTSNDNDWIIYNAPTKKNETTVYSLIYYSREIDNLDSVLSYLDGYYNDELYDGYALETESSHEMEFYFSKHKTEVLQVLRSGINKSLDNSKYYIKERLDKNNMIRGIRLVNKSENGEEKPYYTAFIYIQQEVRN